MSVYKGAYQMEAGERRSQIIQAAARTFARLGYQKANIFEICQEAGIARGTLYQYFKNKNHLFREMLKEYMSKITKFMVPVTLSKEFAKSRVDKGVVEGFLKGRFKAIFKVVEQEKDIFTVFFREALARHTEVEDLVHDWNDKFLAMMTEEILIGMELGILPRGEAEVLADFILGGLFKLSHDYIIEGEQTPDLDWLAAEVSSISAAVLIHRDGMKSVAIQYRESKRGSQAKQR
jgi:AcrR family transcriptional regulator